MREPSAFSPSATRITGATPDVRAEFFFWLLEFIRHQGSRETQRQNQIRDSAHPKISGCGNGFKIYFHSQRFALDDSDDQIAKAVALALTSSNDLIDHAFVTKVHWMASRVNARTGRQTRLSFMNSVATAVSTWLARAQIYFFLGRYSECRPLISELH